MKNRNALYRQIHAAQRKIGLTEDDLRLVLKQHGAKLKGDQYSKTTMSIAQLQQVVEQLNKSTQKPVKKFVKLTNGKIKYAFRLWNDLHRAGAIKDQSFKGFTAWCERMLQTKLDAEKLNGLGSSDCDTLIEPLKEWMKRHEQQA